MEFQGKTYTNHPLRELCETDNNALAPLIDWFSDSKVSEYTHYYSYIVFHTEYGFVACYATDTSNYWNI